MFHAPENWENISEKMTRTLNDVGINEKILLKRRRSFLLMETLSSVKNRLGGKDVTIHLFGSQTEGSTTLGMQSDVDRLSCLNNRNVMQDRREWQRGKENLLIIEDENTTPGYCFLQKVEADPRNLAKHEAVYRSNLENRVIIKNTQVDRFLQKEQSRNGPAFTSSSEGGFADNDYILAFPLKSIIPALRVWLDEQCRCKNISQDMKTYIEKHPCFVVPVGSKDSEYWELEWRISTSHAERCVMFSLNLTQLHCYVLLKLILKCFLNHPSKTISSFMLKNILLLHVQQTSQSIWQPSNLLKLVATGLFHLKQGLISKKCPHFVTGNNLLRGKCSQEASKWFVARLHWIIQTLSSTLVTIPVDDIGRRLQAKLNSSGTETDTCVLQPPELISKFISGQIAHNFAGQIAVTHIDCLYNFMTKRLQLPVFQVMLRYLTALQFWGSQMEQAAGRLLYPLFGASFGSMLASDSISKGALVSREAMNLLNIGQSSDVASGRLKLVSVFYCSGNFDRAEQQLRYTEEKYNVRNNVVEPICECYQFGGRSVSLPFMENTNAHDDILCQITAFCVIFLPNEIHCALKELQYEMFRSTPKDKLSRGKADFWMDWATVDSLPYMYFLQYKTYGHRNKYEDQQRAVRNLRNCIFTPTNVKNFGHRETALNLLGQCLLQENRHQDALCCYTMSLKIRPNNNAAKLLVCLLLHSLINPARRAHLKNLENR